MQTCKTGESERNSESQSHNWSPLPLRGKSPPKKMSHMASNNGIKQPEAMARSQKGGGQPDQTGAILK